MLRSNIEKLFTLNKTVNEIALGSGVSLEKVAKIKNNLAAIDELTILEGENLVAYRKSILPRAIDFESITDKPCKVLVYRVNDSVEYEVGYIETDLEITVDDAVAILGIDLEMYFCYQLGWRSYSYFKLNVIPYTGDKTDRWEV